MNILIKRMLSVGTTMLIISVSPHDGLTQAVNMAEPVVTELQIVNSDLPNDDVSFTTLDNEHDIAVTADLTPDDLDGTYNSQIHWEIEDDPDVEGVTPIPDITALQGENVTIEIVIPLDADGRDFHVLNYRIRAQLTLTDASLLSEWHAVAQDEVDMLRQQYIDMQKNRVPDRDEFINAGNTAHFDLSEGACQCGHHAYHLWSIMNNLETVRTNLGHGMTINSGYRCPIHNAAEGGRAESQHIYGTAADVDVEDWDGNGATDNNGNNIDDDWETLESAALAAGATYIEPFGDTGTWVHMDWRN